MSEDKTPTEETPTEKPGESPLTTKLNLFERLKEGSNGAAPKKDIKLQEDGETEEETPDVDATEEPEGDETEETPPESGAATAAKVLGKGKEEFEAFDGAKKTKLDGGLKFKRKVEGEEKEVEFTLKDAVHNYKTRQRIDQEFSKVDLDRKAVQKEREAIAKDKADIATIDEHLKAILKAGKEGDMAAVYTRLALMFGENTEKTVGEILMNSKKFTEGYDKLSKEEQALFWRKLNVADEELRSKKKTQEADRATAEANIKVYAAKLQQKENISDEQMAAAWNNIKDDPRLQNMTGEQVVETCAQWVKAGKRLGELEALCKKHAPGQEGLLDVLVDLKAHLMPDDEVIELIKGVVTDSASGSEDSEDVSKSKGTKLKAHEATSSRREHQPNNRAEKDKKKVPLRFRDIFA